MSAVIKPCAIDFRDMSHDDLDDVMVVERLAYQHTWSKGIFSDCLRSGYIGIVAERDNCLIGYAMMSIAAGEAHLLNICIHPQMQGSGYGRQLLEQVVEIARHRQVETLFLEVRCSNRVAQHIYLGFGFNEIGLRPNYYPDGQAREDALVYAMTLVHTGDDVFI